MAGDAVGQIEKFTKEFLLTSDLFVDLTGFLVCFQVWLLRGAL